MTAATPQTSPAEPDPRLLNFAPQIVATTTGPALILAFGQGSVATNIGPMPREVAEQIAAAILGEAQKMPRASGLILPPGSVT